MSRVRFQLDEHISHAVAEALRRRGIDVLTIDEAGLRTASDEEIMDQSTLAGRVIVTNDSDFLALHQAARRHAGIAFCSRGAQGIGRVVAGLVLIYEVLEPDEMAGQVEFL